MLWPASAIDGQIAQSIWWTVYADGYLARSNYGGPSPSVNGLRNLVQSTTATDTLLAQSVVAGDRHR